MTIKKSNKIKLYDYLNNNKFNYINDNKIKNDNIDNIAAILSIFDYKIHLLNLMYKTWGRKTICDIYNIPPTIKDYKKFIIEFFKLNNINDVAEARIPIIRNLNSSEAYLNNNYNARLFLIGYKLNEKFIKLYNYIKALKYIISPLNNGILNYTDSLTPIVRYFNNYFYELNMTQRGKLLDNKNKDYKIIPESQIILTLFNFYKTILSNINYNKLSNINIEIKEDILSLFNNEPINIILDKIYKLLIPLIKNNDIYKINDQLNKNTILKSINNISKNYIPLMEFINLPSIDKNIEKISLYNGILTATSYIMFNDNKANIINMDELKHHLENIIEPINNNKKYKLPTTCTIKTISSKINNNKDKNNTKSCNHKTKKYYIINKYLTLDNIENNVKYRVIIISAENYIKNIDGPVISVITIEKINEEIKISNNINIDDNSKKELIKNYNEEKSLRIESIVEF